MTYTLGIDPGLSGAVALLCADGSLSVHDMPVFELTIAGKKRRRLDLHALGRLIAGLALCEPATCVVEDLSGRPATFRNAKGETIAQRGQFEQGWNAAAPVAMAAVLAVPFSLVTPAVWKRALDVPSDKDGARMRASQLMPAHAALWSRVKDDGRAEAALLALYARRIVSAGQSHSHPAPGARIAAT